jgi:heme-degrading monooxygenase HmoA
MSSTLINWNSPIHRPNPNWAVIFSLERSKERPGYDEMDEKTLNEVKSIPGYLGYESVYNGDRGIFISYWENKEAIEEWAKNPLHREAKRMGKTWYVRFISAVTRIEHWQHHDTN